MRLLGRLETAQRQLHISLSKQENRLGTTPYQQAGELAGLTRLVDAFYVNMNRLPEVRIIRNIHPPDLNESCTKLTYFLYGWPGGRRLVMQHYGPVSIPGAHKRFPIG